MIQLFELQNEYYSIEKGYKEINENQQEEFKKEIDFLKHQNAILNDFLVKAPAIRTDYSDLWKKRQTNPS